MSEWENRGQPDDWGANPQAAPERGPSGGQLVRFGLVFYGAMAAVAYAWRALWLGESIFFASAEAAQAGLRLPLDLVKGLAAGIAVLLLSHIFTRSTRWGETLARVLADALGRVSIPGALLLAGASGIAEELLFRGALQPLVGWPLASLLFGLAHLAPRRELLPWTGFAVLAGGLFGWLFDTTGNLLAPITAHFLVNAVNIPVLVRFYRSDAR